MTSEDRYLWQKQAEDAMFSRNIRRDLMDVEDIEDALADRNITALLANLDGGPIDFTAPLLETTETKVMQLEEINEKFTDLITEISEVVRTSLELAATSRTNNADVAWKPLSLYDQAGSCPQCSGNFPLNKISNNKKLVKEVRVEFEQGLLPSYGMRFDRSKRIFSKSQRTETVTIKGEEVQENKIVVDWEVFRKALSDSGIEFEQKSGPMKRKEMLALHKVNSDWGKVAAGLILCSRRSLTCTNLDCKEDLWTHSLDSHRPFHRISYLATRVILEETVGNPATRAPREIFGWIMPEHIPGDFRMGTVGDKGGSTNRRLLAEAVLTATRVLGNLKIGIKDEELFMKSIAKDDDVVESMELNVDGENPRYVRINQSSTEESSRIYVSPNHNIVTKLSSLIQRIRPVEAFIRDGRDISEHKNWAANCAGQVLHAIHQSGELFAVEKTRDYTYQSGKSSKHATNLIRLNDKIQKNIVETFVSEMADGRRYNSLECMLAKETTPPMVCKPVDRTADRSSEEGGQGGLLTKGGQKKYRLITQEPQYRAFGIERFKPSESAISSLNTLQSTEWAVDKEMVAIAKNTIKHHVEEEIRKKLQVRCAWQIRRHYLQDESGTPVLNKHGQPKTNKVKIISDKKDLDEYINSPESKSSTCSAKKAGRIQSEHWFEDYETVLFIDFIGTKPAVTLGQVNSWLNTLDFIERLGSRYPDMKFWHAWHFDWRGRVMPISTMLSPQNDDFARGIITFANPEVLTESGRKWVGRVIASMYSGQPIPASFEGEEREQLSQLIDKLSQKTYEIYDEVSSDTLFQKMMRVIAENPEDNFASWGQGDVFRTKASGLQRLALTREFVSIIDQGENAKTRLPINLDASSSIYQHASALMLDTDMASKVNVLPNGTDKPSDVYLEVIDHLKNEWKDNPFSKFTVNKTVTDVNGKTKTISYEVEGLTDDQALELKNKVLVRNMAKKPVMTIGYGASPQNMVRALLTDNGEDNGRGGGVEICLLGDEWPKSVEEIGDLSDSKYRVMQVAHPTSTLGIMFEELEIPNHFHWLISQKIIKGFTQSIEKVLPGYKKMKTSLGTICDEHLEIHFKNCPICKDNWNQFVADVNNHPKDVKDCECIDPETKAFVAAGKCVNKMKKTFIASKTFMSCCGDLTWTVMDGCQVENVYLEDSKMDSIKAWGGMNNASKAVRTIARKELDAESKTLIPLDNLEMIDFSSLEGNLSEEQFAHLKTHETNKFESLAKVIIESGYSKDSLDYDNFSIDWSILAQEIGVGNTVDDIISFAGNDAENIEQIMNVANAVREYSGTFNTYFSRQIMSNSRDIKGERRGIAPNFIHSLDACHMRMVVKALSRNGVTDIWSVHDAFGCHPNHIDDLRLIVNTTFAQVHAADENGRGALSKLYFEVTGKELEMGDMDLTDIMNVVNGELESRYLIS